MLDPLRTALVVVDMQNDFCSPQGAMASLGLDVSANDALVRRLPGFVDDLRRQGALVVWVRHVERPDMVSPAEAVRREATGLARVPICAPGSWGAQLVDALHPVDGDVSLEKWRFSAFVGTPLPQILHAHGRDQIVVCGTAANVCVDSTVRDASMRGLRVVVPSDMVGWTRRHLADAALETLALYFGEVVASAALTR